MALFFTSCGEKIPAESELFGQAQECEASQEYNRALQAYDMVIENYPESPNRYKAIFMKGYIYTEYLKDKTKALEAFDRLLAEYPDCDLADDARVMREIAEKGADLMSVFEDSVKTE
jgi:outer membrane protein assembly factor BamD (BamD/ComL family)